MGKRPHIVILNPDEMRWDTMGHMGNRAAYTPTLDRIAVREGISFDHAYCQNPVCVPSRCSFLTGLYPHVQGHRTMRYLMQEGEETLFSELKHAGYYVWMNGRNDFFAAQKEGLQQHHADEMYTYTQKGEKPRQLYVDVPYEKKDPNAGFAEKMTETVINDDPDHVYSHFKGIIPDNGRDSDWEDTNAAIERIRHLDQLDGKPLCLFLGWLNPHPPYQVEQKYYDLIREENIVPEIGPEETAGKSEMMQKLHEYGHMEKFSKDRWKEMRRIYLAQCAKVDHMVSAVIDALKEAGIYDDTAIFFFSDHGDWCGDYHLAEKAQNCFEEVLTRVPFLIKPPKGMEVDPGLASSPVELVDFYATAMEWAGVTPCHDHFGRSLTPVMTDRNAKIRTYAFSEGGRMPYESQCDEWHCEGADGGGNRGDYYAKKRAQLDDSAHEKGTMITDGHYKFIYRSSGKHELYDLFKDPYEKINRYGEAELTEIAMKMQAELLKWYQQTCDIVPYAYDNRFSPDKMWKMTRNLIPAEYEDEIRQFIRDTDPSIVNLFEFAARLKEAIAEKESR